MSTFRDDDDRKRFLSFVEKTVLDGDIAVLAFCLMPNHYHLLCSTPHGGLNRWMRSINGGYARAFNQRHGRVGHLRKFSKLTATAIAKRYGRRHSAVSMAVKAIDEEASKSPALAKRIARLSKRLSNEK
jgi:REP element-mobilizing transposase RayT